ncbi:glycosyltransferase [Cohnella sp. CFH 77786]|uniref:CgeB family protein n=1 Tax=Cohnella sp. CFH 77786 TaxID=2662265 RepID=UPI002104C3A1|nr:glycosyltransferase [Cohnella sp. CFH 77786]
MRRNTRMFRNGREDGFRAGWLEGWRLGACERIRQEIGTEPIQKRNARVLYVPQKFEAIDCGVEEALRQLVSHVSVTAPEEMVETARSFKPDLVLVLNGLHIFPPDHPDHVDTVRRMGIPTAVWYADDPYLSDYTSRQAPHYDHVFTLEKACLPHYRSLGCRNVHYLPLAAHFDLYRPLRVKPQYRYDICFIGMGFRNRIRLIDEIAPYLMDKKVFIAGYNWHRLKHYSKLSPFIRNQWIDVPETVHFYNGAKIVINLHRADGAGPDNRNSRNWPGVSVNPRTFEIAACGAFQLTDYRDELPSHYAIGSEIAVYRNAEELVRQIEHYLTHDEERLQTAVRGYRRTVREHSFAGRISRLLDEMGIR